MLNTIILPALLDLRRRGRHRCMHDHECMHDPCVARTRRMMQQLRQAEITQNEQH